MLAYVCWHWPRPGVSTSEYEDHLVRFHRSLASHPPHGWLGSHAFRLDSPPWSTGARARQRSYEDWYLLEGFAALEGLNREAVGPAHAEPHHLVAELSADGTGSLYQHRMGPKTVPPGSVRWLSKPRGVTTRSWLRGFPREARSPPIIWQRALALGPAPEFAVSGSGSSSVPPTQLPRVVSRIRLPAR
jgi:hypothetical protein